MPENVPSTVFISYRRNTAKWIARAIFMALSQRGYDVFMDVESLDSGKFPDVILRQIAARAHFLAILTPDSVHRLNDENDWLRREIECAIKGQRNVVPVLAEGFRFDACSEYWTGGLAELPTYNALSLPHDYFDDAMTRLEESFLIKLPEGTIVPAPDGDLAVVKRMVNQALKESSRAEDRRALRDSPTGSVPVIDRNTEGMERIRRDDVASGGTRAEPKVRDTGADPGPPAPASLKPASRSTGSWLSRLQAPRYVRKGLQHHHNRELEQAIACYDMALQLNPRHADALNFRGVARFDQGDYEGAIADHTTALGLKPDDPTTHNNLGNAHRALGNLSQALQSYTMAVQLDSQYADAHYNRGNVLDEQGEFNEAIGAYSAAIALNPAHADAYGNRAGVYLKAKRFDMALDDLNRALAINPDHANSYFMRAECWQKKGNSRQAMADYRHFLQLCNDSHWRRIAQERLAELHS